MKWRLFRRTAREEPERRDLDTSSVSFPTPHLAEPSAVTEDGALRLFAVLAAGRLLAATIAGMPLNLYRAERDRSVKLAPSKLLRQPSRAVDARHGNLYNWLFQLVTSVAYRGNAVGLIASADANEHPTRIEWLDPSCVYVEERAALTELDAPGSFTNPKWFYMGEEIPASRIVHIPWFQLPGRVWALSPLGAYAVTASTGLAAQRFSDDWFKAGGVPPGRFKNKAQKVDQSDANVIKRRLVNAIRSHEPLVYGADWDYEPYTISPGEAKFVETMRLTATQIAAIYGIPPEMIGGETGGSYSYSSPTQRQIEVLQFAIRPWLELIEAHISALLPRNQFVKFDTNVLVRTDQLSRYQAYEIARRIGLASVNELRAREELPPVAGGDDYRPLAPGGAAPADSGDEGDDDDGRGLRLIQTGR